MSQTVRLIRVFVSSPGDVRAERAVLDEVVESINRTDGQAHGFRLELFRWEDDVAPQIGPRPQAVVDQQTPVYDIYLGIMSLRFGTPTGRSGSGTEKEFKEALKKWSAAGAPWITFYFDEQPQLSGDPEQAEQYVKVCRFRQRTAKQGLYATYRGVRGGSEAFFEKVTVHLRKIVPRLTPPTTATATAPAPPPPPDPAGYLRDLRDKTAYIDIRGLQVGKGRASRFPIEELFISLTTTQAPSADEDAPGRRRGKRAGAERNAEQHMPESRTVLLQNALQHDRVPLRLPGPSARSSFQVRVPGTSGAWSVGRGVSCSRSCRSGRQCRRVCTTQPPIVYGQPEATAAVERTFAPIASP